MAQTAGTLQTTLLARIRATPSTGVTASLLPHDQSVVFAVLSGCQRIVNAATEALLVTETLTRAVGNPLTALTTSLPTILRVKDVRFNGKSLDPVPWRTLAHLDPHWLRRTAAAPRVWSVVGHDLLVIWPARMSGVADGTVEVIGIKNTTTFSTNSTPMEIDDAHTGAVLALAEQVLLLRHRLFTSIKPAAERLKEDWDLGRATPP